MDARIDPAAAFGIDLGDAHIIRNAGGNAKDCLRSVLISQHLLGTREIILVKHVSTRRIVLFKRISNAETDTRVDWLRNAHIQQYGCIEARG